jgi:hypothetical protein
LTVPDASGTSVALFDGTAVAALDGVVASGAAFGEHAAASAARMTSGQRRRMTGATRGRQSMAPRIHAPEPGDAEGGFVPLGYRVEGRALHVVEEHAALEPVVHRGGGAAHLAGHARRGAGQALQNAVVG